MSGEIESVFAVVIPKLSDVSRDCLEWLRGLAADEEISTACQIAEDLRDPRYFVLPRDPGE